MFRVFPSSVVSGVKYPNDYGIVHQDRQYVAPPNPWPVNRPENILFRTKDPSPDIVLVICMPFDLAGRAPGSSGEPLTSVVGTRGTEPKGHSKLVDLWSIEYGRFLPLLITCTAMECLSCVAGSSLMSSSQIHTIQGR
jgi:hypothetical protein